MSVIRLLTLLAGGAAAAYFTRKKLSSLEPRQNFASDDTVLLYQYDYSPFCAKVRHVLDFKGIDHQIVELTPMIHKNYSRRISGQIKVPYIRHRGQAIADSTAICLYLEEVFPDRPVLPSDPVEREQVLLLEDWLDEGLQPALGKMAYLYLYLNPQIAIDDPKIATGVAWIDSNKDKIVPLMLGMSVRKNKLTADDMPRLEARLKDVLGRVESLLKGKEYLVGDSMTLADLSLLGHLNTSSMHPLFQPGGPYTWLMDWRERRLTELQAEAVAV